MTGTHPPAYHEARLPPPSACSSSTLCRRQTLHASCRLDPCKSRDYEMVSARSAGLVSCTMSRRVAMLAHPDVNETE